MEIKLFNSPQFGEIRTAGTADDPQFCLSDVCRILDLSVKGVGQRLDEGVISNYPLQTAGGVQQMKFVNEDGLYDVILDSRKQEAKAFRKWITSEVLPQIRRTGGYIQASVEDTPEEIMARALLVANKTMELQKQRLQALAEDNERKQLLIEEQKPKVLFADAVATARQSCLIGELAKILKQNGVEIGQNRMFPWLRDNEYLGKFGQYYNIPTQKAMEMGLFELKKTTVNRPDGSILVTTTTKVTGKGQQYFINKFLGGHSHDAAPQSRP